MAQTSTAAETPRTPPRRSKRVTDTVRTASKTARTKVDNATRAAAHTLEANPLGALAGAIAAGAVAAALIPATRQELKALGPWAEKMRDALEEAFDAAKDAGAGELSASGLTLAAASDGAGGLVGKLVKAALAAGSAAATSVKETRGGTGSNS